MKHLEGKTILLVEDEALIAMDLEAELMDAGATVVGPIPGLEAAKVAARDKALDAAILDIMLGRDEVFPAADILIERKIPFVFHSAHAEVDSLKADYPGAPLQPKPSDLKTIIVLLADLIGRD